MLTTIDVGVTEFAHAGAAVMLEMLTDEDLTPRLPFKDTHVSVLVEGKSTPRKGW